MAIIRNRLASAGRYLFGFLLLLVAFIGFAAFRLSRNDEFSLAKQQILLRKIGHDILLSSGDSTSRVLPVEQIGAGKYQLQFGKAFTFKTDTLVKIIKEALDKEDYRDYIVNVLDCSDRRILYGYAISKNGQNDIVPCRGRIQPQACYLVTIEFQVPDLTNLPKGYLVGGATLFAFMGMLAVRPFRRRNTHTPVPAEEPGFRIGNTLFNAEKRTLTVSGIVTELTPKENKLLRIFATTPNEIIERSRIQKEIWEDEGVIVGRSLDMFISKLRKKLENDPSIQLVNIHGKGYKLQISVAV